MADAPQNPLSSPPLTPPPPPPPPRRRAATFILPFIPVVLALGIALTLRFYPHSPPTSVQIGDLAPDFSLQDAHNQPSDPPVTLSLLLQKSPVLIVFHHGFGCPTCLAYLKEISDQIDDFRKAGLQVVAISAYDLESTRDSLAAWNLNFAFPLLFDPDDKTAFAYNLQDPVGTYYYGVFIVDQDRRIRFAARTDVPLEAFPDFLQEGRKLQHP